MSEDDKITIFRSQLKELELELMEDRKRIDRHLRFIALLRGNLPEKPVMVPLASPTGRQSKCVELAKHHRKSAKKG
jgi:hypothetical protein